MRADDLLTAAGVCRAALAPAVERDWMESAGDLKWNCRRTLDHISDALLFYAAHLATRATERLTPVRNGDPAATVPDLLRVVESAAAILTRVAIEAGTDARAFHSAGMADADGFRAMGCQEMLTHTHDIASGLDLPFAPPEDLCDRILRRIFPWAPDEAEQPDRWAALRWACGRAALPDRPRLDPDWWWHCAPLAEWDGTRRVRTSPPAWT